MNLLVDDCLVTTAVSPIMPDGHVLRVRIKHCQLGIDSKKLHARLKNALEKSLSLERVTQKPKPKDGFSEITILGIQTLKFINIIRARGFGVVEKPYD